MKLMLYYIRKYKRYVFLSIICSLGFVLIEIGLPTLLARMIDKGILAGDFEVVKQIGLFMVLICAIGFVGLIGLAYSGSKITTSITRDIRNDVFEKVQGFSHSEFGKFGSASLITRTTNDAFKIMTFLQMALRVGIIAPLMLITSLIMVINVSPSLSLGLLGAIPPIILGVFIIGKKADPLSAYQQATIDGINMKFKESLTGLRVIRAFGKEELQRERFNEVNTEYAGVSKKLFKLMAIAQPGFWFIFSILFIFVISFGAMLIGKSDLLVGDLVAFVEYIFHAMFSTMLFANVFIMYPLAAVSAKRIQKILDTEASINENEYSKNIEIKNGKVEFKNVSFAYGDDETILKNISFTANPGETVAIIGSTGSGKSTLIHLIPRFYDATSGEVLIDGVNVKEYNLKSLRKGIGMALQKAVLFTGTIKENFLYGKEDATISDMEKASEIAQAKYFIEGKEKRYDEFLSEGGNNLSGGQKQRLSIARAIVRKPKIYIFDDSFSALDYKTDASLRAALKEETENKTVIIVAQRVGTIRNADKIIVLNNGEIAAIGKHKELLKTSDIYYDIASSQLSREELIQDEK